MVLGIPFFEKVNPRIDWKTRTIEPKGGLPTQHLRIIEMDARALKKSKDFRRRGGLVYLRSTLVDKPPSVESVVPKEYHGFLDVFSKRSANTLAPHRPFNHRIPLTEGVQSHFGPIYLLSSVEQNALKEYIEENLEKGFIRPSESPAGAPILFVKKKDGSLRLCMDYRRLNAITIKNQYPLPLIGDLIDQLRDCTVYTKIDLRGAYNLLQIAEGEEWKTAFRTRYGLFEYKVMPFGLTNAPASFQHLMNQIFRDILDVYVIVYLDNILIYSKSENNHWTHVCEVLKRLRANNLFAKHDKCNFHTSKVEFLGFLISANGVEMDPEKIKAVAEWPMPNTVKEVQSFLGFANFYRRFFHDFGRIARPLNDLTKKGTEWLWSDKHQTAFVDLVRALVTGPVLRHYSPNLECIVKTDASDYALGAVLSQRGEHGTLRPVAYASRSMKPAELNYEVHDKEMVAIVYALGKWRHYLEGSKIRFEVLSDHKGLEYFFSSKLLNRRQARWQERLAEFDFTITYRPGKQAGKPDALSRRVDYHPRDTTSTSLSWELNPFNERPLLSRTQLLNAVAMVTGSEGPLDEQIRAAYEEDEWAIQFTTGKFTDPLLSKGPDKLIQRNTSRYVPRILRDEILRDNHDSRHAGHPGRTKTLFNVRRLYWWPEVCKGVFEYVDNCPTCQRDKVSCQKPMGLLMPLPVPGRSWADITCDMIGELPESNGFNSIVVFVDRFTKMAKFIPSTTKLSADGYAELFVAHVYASHGLPDQMVTDRGSLFTSRCWRTIASLLKIDHRYSTAYHPQTDGQTEIVNQWLEQYIRMYTTFEQDDWSTLLQVAEFCYNSTTHSSTGLSPFMALTGIEPRKSLMEPLSDIEPAGLSAVGEL